MTLFKKDWPAAIRRFPTARVVVVGDVMLDRYWYGGVSRVSPEAPVVVVSKTHAVHSPGGAANTAANVGALGGRVSLIGVVGRDSAAAEMRAAMEGHHVDAVHLLEDPERPTTVKTRVVAHHQHVVRIDEESSAPLTSEMQLLLLAKLEESTADAGAVIVSDYAKGVLTESCIGEIIGIARRKHAPVFVDPKSRHAGRYAGATLIKPNRAELGALANTAIPDRPAAIRAATSLLPQLAGGSILVTEGAEGMTLVRQGCEPVSFSGVPKTLYDVTGAGDTVIATVALAVASGCDLAEAAYLASHAATRVIEKLGTDVCTAEDLIRSVAE